MGDDYEYRNTPLSDFPIYDEEQSLKELPDETHESDGKNQRKKMR